MRSPTVADRLAAWIVEHGGGVAFLVAGAQIDPIVERAGALGVRLVPMASEFGAAAAADARSRRTGGVGVCLAIGGPGLANAVPALTTARSDGSRVVAITGAVPTSLAGRGGFQDSRTDAAAAALAVGASRRVGTADAVDDVLAWLDEEVEGGGCAHLVVPWDVQQSSTPSSRSQDDPPPAEPSTPVVSGGGTQGLPPATAPVLVVADSTPPIDPRALHRYAHAGGRVVLTIDAIGVLDRASTAGAVDPAGGGALADLLEADRPDVVVQIGGCLGERSLGLPPDVVARRAALVHVAAHRDGPCTEGPYCIGLVDVASWLPTSSDVAARGSDGSSPGPPRGPVDGIVGAVEQAVGSAAVVVVDAGRARSAVARTWHGSVAGAVLSATTHGPMGWSLGAAVGAATVDGEPVVVIVGDGSALLALGELRTIAASGADIRVVVLADSGYSSVRRRLQGTAARATTTAPAGVDWVGLGRSLGLRSTEAATPGDVAAAAAQPGPSLVAVNVAPPAPAGAGVGWRGGR